MVSTALDIAAQAYNDAGTDQTLTSFTMAEWPYSIALDVINAAIAEINRAGDFQFSQTAVALPYGPSINSYDLDIVGPNPIEPRRIIYIFRSLVNEGGQITEINYRDFLRLYRVTPIITAKPTRWSKFGHTIYLNTQPDQDYSLTMYYYDLITPIAVGVNDTLPTIIPEADIDVLRDMTNAMLLKEMGRADFVNQYTLATKKVNALVARSNMDTGYPTVFPRAF